MINIYTLAQLNEHYNKSTLEKGIFPFVKNFYQQLRLIVDLDPEIIIILDKIDNKKPLTKPELLKICFSVFDNEIIYKKFLRTLPQHINLLIEKLLWVEKMTEAEIEVFIEQKISTAPKLNYASSFNDLINEFYFFTVDTTVTHSFPQKGYYSLSIIPYFKQVLVNYYPKPLHYNFIPKLEIPETSFRFSAERSIMIELPKILSYYMQDGIKYSAKGKPLEGTLNKMQRNCGITEFELCIGEDLGKIRTNLIAGLLYNFRVDNISIDTVSIIKELFTDRYQKLRSVQFILAHLKGWGFLDLAYDFNTLVEKTILGIVKELPSGKWISLKNLVELIECRFINLQPVMEIVVNNRLYYSSSFDGDNYRGYDDKVYLGGKNHALVYLPFIKGTIFLFASFGLIEIANDELYTKQFNKTYFSPFDGLKYFKLTALGAFVFGQASTYESEFTLLKNKIQLSEDSLMILAEGEMSVLDIMLSNFAEKAGNNRYRVSHAHFLRNCQKATDIEKKIILFKQTISTKLPVYWQHQFEMWNKNALKIISDNSIRIFKIPASDKDLQRIIAQDPILKSLIFKAEQFNVLVPVNNLTKFKARMKELSYLVE